MHDDRRLPPDNPTTQTSRLESVSTEIIASRIISFLGRTRLYLFHLELDNFPISSIIEEIVKYIGDILKQTERALCNFGIIIKQKKKKEQKKEKEEVQRFSDSGHNCDRLAETLETGFNYKAAAGNSSNGSSK